MIVIIVNVRYDKFGSFCIFTSAVLFEVVRELSLVQENVIFFIITDFHIKSFIDVNDCELL